MPLPPRRDLPSSDESTLPSEVDVELLPEEREALAQASEEPASIRSLYELLKEVKVDQKKVLASLPPPPRSGRTDVSPSMAARAASGTVTGGKWLILATGALTFLVQFVVAPLLDDKYQHLRGPIIEILRVLLAALGGAPAMP